MLRRNYSLALDASVADRIVETVASVNVYYTPVLVVLGSVGNLVSVFVFYSSKLRLQSTSQYLTALAISDTVFLMQLLPPWLTAVHGDGLFQAPVFCQVFVYASYVSSCLSSWLVVAFTVERFVAVVYPLRRSAVCTRARARLVVFSLAGGAVLLNLPVLRFAQPSHDNCSIDDAYLGYAAVFNILDALLAFTLPLSAIGLLNARIVCGVVKMWRGRRRLLRGESGAPALPPCTRSQQRITIMLLIVSSVFVAFNLPAYTIRVIAYACDMRERDNNATWEAMQQLALMFFNTNYGINFVLYCLSGQNFRSALKASVSSVGSERARRAAAGRSASCGPPLCALRSSNVFYGGGGGGGGGGVFQRQQPMSARATARLAVALADIANTSYPYFDRPDIVPMPDRFRCPFHSWRKSPVRPSTDAEHLADEQERAEYEARAELPSPPPPPARHRHGRVRPVWHTQH